MLWLDPENERRWREVYARSLAAQLDEANDCGRNFARAFLAVLFRPLRPLARWVLDVTE